jgi:hypothetical protein
MSKPKVRFIAGFVALAFICLPAASACNFTPKETEDRNIAVLTSAAQTIDTNSMQLTITAQQALLTSQAQTLAAPPPSLPAVSQPVETQPPVQTEPPPVQTEAPPVQTEAPPPPVPTMAPLPPQLPKISADVETKCRSGPSPAYPVVSFILVGQQSVVLGANPEHTWWLIEDPRKPGSKCWVWGSTTRLISDSAGIPVVEPPPPPLSSGAPSFQAEFTNFHGCGGVATATFRVYNSGGVPFLSSSILIKDLASDQGIAGPETSNNPFMDGAGNCPPGREALAPGSAAYIAKGVGAVPPAGTKARAVIVLCSAPNQSGQCVETNVTFVFP